MRILDLSRARPFAFRLHAVLSAVHEFSGLLVSRLVSEEDVQLTLYVNPGEPLTVLHPDEGSLTLQGGQALSFDWRLGITREDIALMQDGRAARFRRAIPSRPPLEKIHICPTCRRPWLAGVSQGGEP